MKPIAEFSIQGYRKLLADFAALGYVCCTFAAANPQRRDLILRHDIDMSLEAALELAEVEAEAGVSATYFVLVCSDLYNPFSKRNSDRLRRLLQLGHAIGLHFDASLLGNDINTLSNATAHECSLLEGITGQRIEVISFHRPAKALLGLADSLSGRLHAYQPRFFSEMGYCSDSRGAWHHGHPLKHSALRNGLALQLLTHPIWWTGEVTAPETKLKRFLTHAVEELDQELAAQCGIHRPDQILARRGDAT
jgi:hypothetical protein